MKMEYSIGQVVFVAPSKKNQIYPMQVIEIITKKTLKGNETQYLLQGGADKEATILLNQIDGEVFETDEKARRTLVERAIKQINRLVDLAVSKSKEWYPNQENLIPQTIQDLPDFVPNHSALMENEDNQENVSMVVLPDGTVAKVKLPSI